MKARMALAAAVLLAVSSSANAETAAETVARWGLPGIWSADCDSVPSEANVYLHVSVGNNGRASLPYDSGEPRVGNEIVAAKIGSDLSLTLQVRSEREAQTREISYVKAATRIMRVLANHKVGGAYTVKDGKFVRTGETTLWLLRCY